MIKLLDKYFSVTVFSATESYMVVCFEHLTLEHGIFKQKYFTRYRSNTLKDIKVC